MNKSFRKTAFFGLTASFALFLVLKIKSAKAQDSKDLLTDAVFNASDIQTINVIGDSQTKRHLGKAYQEIFSDKDVRFFGKEGATHEKYLKDPQLLQEIKNLGCADLVIIQLGDNSVSNRTNSITDFAGFVQDVCPNAQLVWGGPMKAVRPTISSNYVLTEPRDSREFKYLPNYNEARRIWDQRLRDALQDSNVLYISNFDLQEAQPLSSEFSDSRGGDGVHLTKDSALNLAQLMREILFGEEST